MSDMFELGAPPVSKSLTGLPSTAPSRIAEDSLIEENSFDVESNSGWNLRDVLPVESQQHCSLPCIVQATENRSRSGELSWTIHSHSEAMY